MTNEKFEDESNIVYRFIQTYCTDKHSSKEQYHRTISYKGKSFEIKAFVCKECSELLEYSIERLSACPHLNKPKCRKCPEPCYEKKQWKQLAKIMRYSGVKLGFIKIKEFLFRQ